MHGCGRRGSSRPRGASSSSSTSRRRGELLKEQVGLVNVDLAGAITVSLGDHVLHLLVIDVLSELLSHAGKVAEGDPGGVVVVEQLEHLEFSMSSRESFSPILPVIIWRNSAKSMVPLPSPSMSETIFLSSSSLTPKPRERMAALSSRVSVSISRRLVDHVPAAPAPASPS